MDQAFWLRAIALSCASCSLDSTPDASGMVDMRANAGRGELLSQVMAEAGARAPKGELEWSAEKAAGSPARNDMESAPNSADAGASEPQSAEAMRNAPAMRTLTAAGAAAPVAGAGGKDASQAPKGGAASQPKPPEPSAPAAAGSTGSMPSTRCMPGNYVGTFAGTVQVLSLPVTGITGTVIAELVASKAGDRLAIANSRIDGMANAETSVTAKLVGVVNCTTLELEGGALEEGVLTSPDLFGESGTTTFSGDAAATYSSAPPALKGTWKAAPGNALGGSGSWSIALSQLAQ
jgi:hypothetical protein